MLHRAHVLAFASTFLIAPLARAEAQGALHHTTYTVTPYLWLSGVNGDVGVRDVATNIDLSAMDVLDILKFGFMASGSARMRPYVFAIDVIYSKVGDGTVFAFRGDTGSFSLTQSEWIVQPTAGWSLGDDAEGVDVLAGVRYWNVGADLDVHRPRASNRRSASRSWVDATGGVQGHYAPGWFRVDAGADGGGGGSRSTWQAWGALGATIYGHWTGRLGYRWLGVDYDRNNFLYDTTLQGALFSVSYGF